MAGLLGDDLWGTIGQLGLGILAASQPGTSFGEAIGRGGLLGLQNATQMQQAQQLGELRKVQIDQAKADAERKKRWAAMFGGAAPVTPAAPGIQMASGDPSATAAAMTPAPGERPGPTVQAANRLNTAAASPIDMIPPHMRPLVAAMGPEQGAQFIAGLAAKQMETGQWVDLGNGLQRNRLTGETKPISPKLVEANINPTIAMPAQRKAEDEKIGTMFGEMYANMQKESLNIPSRIGKLDRLDSLLSQTYTGVGGEQALQVNRALKAAGDALGVNTAGLDERIAPAEAARALANEMALELRNPSGGAGMPGAMSDEDRAFLQSMVPGLATTPEGRKAIVETRRRLLRREQEIAKMARDYRKKHGNIDEGFFDELAAFSAANPLFADMTAPAAQTQPGAVQRLRFDAQGNPVQ